MVHSLATKIQLKFYWGRVHKNSSIDYSRPHRIVASLTAKRVINRMIRQQLLVRFPYVDHKERVMSVNQRNIRIIGGFLGCVI